MNCRYVGSRLSAYVDGELTGRETLLVRQHLDYCISCLAELNSFIETKQLLGSLRTVPVPPDLENRLLASVFLQDKLPWWQRLRTEARANWLAWSVGFAGLATTLVIAVVPEQRDLFTKGHGAMAAGIHGGAVPTIDPETRTFIEDHNERRPDAPFIVIPEQRAVPLLYQR